MNSNYALDTLLRPAVELYTVLVCAAGAFLCIFAPWALALTPLFGLVTAAMFLTLAVIRCRQALRVLRYRRHIRRLTAYSMTSKEIPISNERLFIGKGFRWGQQHTQRLVDTYLPQYAPYVEASEWTNRARRLEARLEFAPIPLSTLVKLTATDKPWNPFRPLPPVGGLPRLHGIEPNEHDVSLPLGEWVGHSIVLGTTRVGKTAPRAARGRHRVRSQGDADLLKCMYVECRRAGRLNEFYVFHLGWPDHPARYNAVGRFGRLSGWPPASLVSF